MSLSTEGLIDEINRLRDENADLRRQLVAEQKANVELKERWAKRFEEWAEERAGLLRRLEAANGEAQRTVLVRSLGGET